MEEELRYLNEEDKKRFEEIQAKLEGNISYEDQKKLVTELAILRERNELKKRSRPE
ncbi:hypothetical protein [Marinococcus luteus]|uniref:hypothetical protein n=1 Tax=Marinococcus luteus TaxID=1122204 RepID=UPI002ACC79BC|nr:hypothetical protein [Marinococcus luteus]MDZ5782593.1 hypothetical protein [Marinococcus luteus]